MKTKSDLVSAIKAISTEIRSTSVVSVVRKQSDTIEQVRAKVVKKLRASAAYVSSGMIDKVRPIELAFQPEVGGTYAIGVRYGIRWLQNVDGDGKQFFHNVKRDELVSVLEALANAVANGCYDDELLSLQKQHAARMRKAA